MRTKKLKIGIFLISCLFVVNTEVIAKTDSVATLNNNISLNIQEKNKLKIKSSKPVNKITTQLFLSEEEALQNYFQTQKEMDIEDIKRLWESTVERNPVIKFALKKLALPADQRRVHSSRMTKTLSTLISGASILPSMLGADAITSSVTSAGGSLASRVVSKRNLPKDIPLSDTELIQLARLIEELQDRLIKNYYTYKSDLESFKIARENLSIQNKIYYEAIQSNKELSIIAAKTLYDRALQSELKLKQNIKLSRLELERLAGKKALTNLDLGKLVFNQENIRFTENDSANIDNTPPVPNKEIKTYSNKNLNVIAEEICSELEEEEQNMLADLRILWNATMERSETIRFSIMKLSNPDGEVEKRSAVKKILSPLANVASVIGVSASNPVAATSALFGGELLNSLLSDDNKLNAKLSKVTDADLVLLAQEADNLQRKLVTLYYSYYSALKELNLVDKVVSNSYNSYVSSLTSTPEVQIVADIFYRDALNSQYEKRQQLLSDRVALEQFVGNKAVISVEKNLKEKYDISLANDTILRK